MKTFKRLVVSIVSLSLTVSLTGCGIIREMMSILNGSYPEEVSTSEPTSYEKVETMIGKDGGVVKDEEENVTISIPQGALQEDTNISAQYIEEPSYLEANPSMNFLGAVEFGPSGTTFDKPVEVSLQLTDTPKHNKISIFCYSEEYDQWDFVTEANVNYNVATFSMSHFSKYKALDMSKGMLMKFHDLVRQAQATGQPDSWVLENFEEYLINEEHVMDIYALYGGYWYEPCGLIIGGNYHINGKEGDPNQLTELIGKSNKVGNTYGLCHDGQLVVDVKTYNEIKGKPKEGQETISINVGVFYEMIKPDIDLTASKKNLHKGDSATINIRCHYVNATNYFDEFKDLDMDNYMLTIKKPSHFDIDKTAVLTKNGRESFIVTAKEENVAETITVNFDVSGDHGVHAEGNITLNSQGYHVSGHIIEEKTFSFESNAPSDIPLVTTQKGTFKLTVEYDFEGDISENEGQLTGLLSYSNLTASLSSTPYKGYARDEDGTAYYVFDVYGQLGTVESSNPTFNITGEKSIDNQAYTYISDEAKTIGVINGSGYSETNIPEYDAYYKQDHTFEIAIKSNTAALLNFALEAGTQSYSSPEFKDEMSEIFYAEGSTFSAVSLWGFSSSSENTVTTQTITVN